MRHLIVLLTSSLFLFSCGQGDTKQKESLPNEKDSSASMAYSNKNKNQEITKTTQDNNTDISVSLNLDGEWKDCKGKWGSIRLIKNGDGYLLKPTSDYMNGDVTLKKKQDGIFVDPELGFILKYDKQKKTFML